MSNPDQTIHHIATSSELPANQRYEHWLAPLLSDFEAAAPNAQQRRNFRARVSSLVSTSSELHDMRSDDFHGSRSKQRIRYHENNKLALVYVVQGRILGRYDGDTDIVANAGEFLLFDAQRPNHVRFCQQPHFVQINLPRHHLQPLLSGSALPSQISRAVSRSGLASLLSSQLAQFRTLSPGLSPNEQRAFLHATEALATHVVESACLDGELHMDQQYQGLYAAAVRFIHLHMSDPDLNSVRLAAAMQCSRTTLYRAFAAQGSGVAETLRDLRLQEASRLLQEAPAHCTIANIAARCGFVDQTGFSRLFRRRFGVRPSDIRFQRRV